jgi:hypothetical protein
MRAFRGEQHILTWNKLPCLNWLFFGHGSDLLPE